MAIRPYLVSDWGSIAFMIVLIRTGKEDMSKVSWEEAVRLARLVVEQDDKSHGKSSAAISPTVDPKATVAALSSALQGAHIPSAEMIIVSYFISNYRIQLVMLNDM